MFDRLAGNDRVKESLRRMLSEGRVAGALLFAGEDGIGKKLFALELAKALNCRSRVNGVEACDRCSSCVRITQSKFPPYPSDNNDKDNKERVVWSDHTDVGLVRPFKHMIRVDPMREVEREANFRPYEGNARVFLIEDADELNEFASNALLKTLEEPSSNTHLILISSRPSMLLGTIRSRCHTIRFAPFTASEIEQYLVERDPKLSRDDARLLAHAARGSLGRALSTDLEAYLEQREAMLGVLDALATSKDRVKLLRAAEELSDARRKDEYEPRLSILETLIHDVWTLSLGHATVQLTNFDLLERLKAIGARLESRRAARWLMQIEEYRCQFIFNINRKVATDALLLGMSAE